MNLSKNFFLNSIKKFPYGLIEIEWPNGEIETIKAEKEGIILQFQNRGLLLWPDNDLVPMGIK